MDHREPRAPTFTPDEDGQVVALEAELADLQASNHLNRQAACGLAFDHGRLTEEAASMWSQLHRGCECCWGTANFRGCVGNPYRVTVTK